MRPGKPRSNPFLRACLDQFSPGHTLHLELMRAEGAEAALAAKMHELKAHFGESCGHAPPARLCLHRTGRSLALRWRLASGQRQAHDFFELRDDRSPGREVLAALSKTRCERFLKYAGEALTLNVAYAVYRYRRDRLLDHQRKLEALAQTQARHLAGSAGARDPTP
jgi:hypothetical protein